MPILSLAKVDSAGNFALPGALRLVGFTSSAAAATIAQYPNNKDFGIHKNTISNIVTLCFNDNGNIKSIPIV